MKVLIASPKSFSNLNGLYEYNLCKQLECDKQNVTSLTLSGDNSTYCRKAIRVPRYGFLPLRLSQEFFSSFVQRLLTFSAPDILHLNSALWSFFPLQLASINKLLMQRKGSTILTTHAFYPEYQKRIPYMLFDSLRHFEPNKILFSARLFALNCVDKIICLSNIEKKFLIEKCAIKNEKISVIPNAVDLSRFNKLTYDFKEKIRIEEDFMLLYVGQVIPIKDIPTLLRALKIVKSQGISFTLVVITYNLQEDVYSQANALGLEKNIKLINYQNSGMTDLDLVSAYISSDLFILPSKAECLPTVLLEAMASKTAIVATRVGGIPELVLDSYNGFLCEPSNPKDLAEKIFISLDSTKQRKKMGENGYALVKSKYNWDRIYPQIKKLYLTLLK